jgi:hypothetical protein
MSTIDSEVLEEPDGILGVHGDRRCPGLGRAAASADAASVAADALEPVEGRILDEWPHGVGDVGAVDQQDLLPPTRNLVGDFDAVDPVIDQTALAQYKSRIAELESEIDQAHERGDGEAAAVAQEELDALITQLTAAYGLGGRSRRTPDHVERARKAVSRRLRDAITRIAHAHPRLGRHLDASIRTGAFCSYQPERDTVWAIENPYGLTIDPADWDCSRRGH